jgi:TolA-binding protein
VYPDPRVTSLVEQHFIPVRVHAKENAAEYKTLSERFGAQWTPTVLTIDKKGQERHRIEGFLPADDFLAQLALGAAHAAFAVGDFDAAAKLFDDVSDRFPTTDAGPEAQYWAGVSRYKATGDASALKETARKFSERFQESSWAKKSSVWR